MSEKETVADIVAELRQDYKGRPPLDRAETTWNRRRLADRIEAAHKREVGNGAKIREALERIRTNLTTTYTSEEEERNLIVGSFNIAGEALAAPPRNCDVGTAEEQRVRYNRFCRQHAPCDNGNCPLRVTCDCIFTWAQMPYESKEGGEAND